MDKTPDMEAMVREVQGPKLAGSYSLLKTVQCSSISFSERGNLLSVAGP